MIWIVFYCACLSCLWFNDQFFVQSKYLLEKDYEQLISRVSISLKKSLLIRLTMTFMSMLMATIIFKTEWTILVGAIIGYKSYYYGLKKIEKKQKQQAKEVFPYYLNHLAMLIQSQPIANALYKSIDHAPILFKEDLEILVKQLHLEEESIEPYLDFAKKYPEIEDLPRIMRCLYHLSVKTYNKEAMMNSLSMMTHEKVSVQTKQSLKNRLDAQQLIPYSLFLWLGLYIVALFAFVKVW